LPAADYQVWVRGYGLSDSDKTAAEARRTVNLTAKNRRPPADAAKVYPAIYWYSMQKLPTPSEVSKLSGAWTSTSRRSRTCRASAASDRTARDAATIPPAFGHGQEGWVRRIQSGRPAARLLASAQNQLGGVPPKYSATGPIASRPASLPHRSHHVHTASSATFVATVYNWATPSVYITT